MKIIVNKIRTDSKCSQSGTQMYPGILITFEGIDAWAIQCKRRSLLSFIRVRVKSRQNSRQ